MTYSAPSFTQSNRLQEAPSPTGSRRRAYARGSDQYPLDMAPVLVRGQVPGGRGRRACLSNTGWAYVVICHGDGTTGSPEGRNRCFSWGVVGSAVNCWLLAAPVGLAFDDEFVGGGGEAVDGGLG